MKGIQQTCLSCSHFRLIDVLSGVCRVDKTPGGEYPAKRTEERCDRWRDSGQQYFIRIGWIKARTDSLHVR